MGKVFYAGLSVGVLSGLWAVSSDIFALVSFAGFLGWSTYFAAGGGLLGLRSAVICNISGVIWAAMIVLVGGYLNDIMPERLSLFLSITFFAAMMVWQSKISLLAFVPGTFIGSCAYFSTGGEIIDSLIGLFLGAIFGYVSDIGGHFLYKKLGKK